MGHDVTSVALTEATEKAHTLIEALPYIRSYRGRTVVVKIGGAALDDAELAAMVADDIALLSLVGMRIVIVHGGGPQITAALADAGIESRFIDGLRVTGAEEMEIVRRVLVGSINADLVARLTRAGVTAVGLSGADGHLLEATRALGSRGEDLGQVGRVTSVQGEVIDTLLEGGYTPVIATVAVDADETPLNVNADVVAGAVAAALGAEKLVYLTNIEGLYRDLGDSGSLIPEVTGPELAAMVDSLSAGMRPKVRSALDALEAGVAKIHILDGRVHHALLLEVFTDDGIGTQVIA